MTQPKFTHPLARHAKVWTAHNDVGISKDVLVIVTTLELEVTDEHHKADKVAKLSDDARAWIAETQKADDFVLVIGTATGIRAGKRLRAASRPGPMLSDIRGAVDDMERQDRNVSPRADSSKVRLGS